ncbi:outer membrane protein assembly factor BamC [Sansalvadorimonas sp. 2012CJ34-2]|uniref:Outer membrane protein assembly factor BamC n=1 Tax=Parendozoicomonas callyspongiae TaxID=2942213 RepID=A0ABT0PJF8_9GAMM|nr:outer membrane protein assembly factor BamC [Sansalvadorimonas sp. 2012CJ34-2]MCL6271525.1 outer membrane protein assembly factor BamC [Sansalvadorimonas sp. 2012CJ34-2]
MKHVYKVFTLAGASLLLGACSSLTGQDGYLRDKGGDYLNESMIPELKIPKSLDPVAPEDYLLVPTIPVSSAGAENVVPRADQRFVQDNGITFQVVQRSEGRVLLADYAPDVIWSYMSRFWDSNSIPLEQENVAAGTMETAWVQLGEKSNPGMMRQLFGKVIELENSEVSQEKFRVAIRQGNRADTSEVLLKHARLPIEANNQTPVNWSAIKPGASFIDGQLLNEMLLFMVKNRQDQGGALASDDFAVNAEANIIRDGNGNPALAIDQNFASSWQAVEQALKKMGASVTDKNRTAGLVYLTLEGGKVPASSPSKDEKSKGWFSGLFSSDKEEVKKPAADNEFRLRVQSVGDGTQVTLEKDINTLPPVELSDQFLTKLLEYLG